MKLFSRLTKFVERWLTKEVQPANIGLCDFECIRHELKGGDVLLIEGRSRVANIIRYITHSNWTHSSFYVGRLYDIEDPQIRESVRAHFNGPEEEQLIIESDLGIGTVVRSLKVHSQEHIRICRPKGLSHHDGQKVIAYAVSQLGKKYHTRQIFDLMRFFLPYKALPPRLGSSLFNMKPGSATKTVCSSLIAEAFCSICFPILPLVKAGEGKNMQLYHRNPRLCTPKDFDYSPYFQIIKYPFFNNSHTESYRLLPWSGDKEALTSKESGVYITEGQLSELRNFSKSKKEPTDLSSTK